MRLPAFVACLALLGCSEKKPVSGNDWARKTLGEGASGLLRHYDYASVAAQTVALKEATMYLPRPFAILHKPDERDGTSSEGPPEFHPLNAALPSDLAPSSATDLRALVHVERASRTKRLADIKIKRRTLKNYTIEEFTCVAVGLRQPDGSFRTVAAEAIDTVDPQELLEYLKSLPQSP